MYRYQSRKKKKNADDDASTTKKNRLDTIKHIVYGTVDGVTNLVSNIKEPDSFRIVDGYSDLRLQQQTMEQQQQSQNRRRRSLVSWIGHKMVSKKHDPTQQQTSKEGIELSTVWVPIKPIHPLSSSSSTTSRMDTTPFLDRFKGTVYGLSDVIGNGIHVLLPPDNGPFSKQRPATSITNTMLIRTIPPVIQPRPSITTAVPTMTTKTTKSIWQDPSKVSSFEQWKETMYSISDSISATGQQMAQLPSEIRTASQQTKQVLERVESDVQNTVQTIQELPQTIQQTRQEIVQTTLRWIQIIRNAPMQMQRQILNTVDQIRSIPQTMRSKWIDAYTTVRIWFRLESPRPSPPILEPPANAFRTNADDSAVVIATATGISSTPFRDLTWALIQISARGIWWSMTQLPMLTWTGMMQIRSAALQKQQSQQQQRRNENKQQQSPPVVSSTTITTTTATTSSYEDHGNMDPTPEKSVPIVMETSLSPTTVKDDERDRTDLLMKEVTEALALAEVALQEADRPIAPVSPNSAMLPTTKSVVPTILVPSSEQPPNSSKKEQEMNRRKKQDDSRIDGTKDEGFKAFTTDTNDDLLAEVTEALALAEEALRVADEPIPKVSKEALARTQKAAVESLLSMDPQLEKPNTKDSGLPEKNDDITPTKMEFRASEVTSELLTSTPLNKEPVTVLPNSREPSSAKSPSLLQMINRAKTTSFSDQKIALTGKAPSKKISNATTKPEVKDSTTLNGLHDSEKQLTATDVNLNSHQDAISLPESASSSLLSTTLPKATNFYRKNGITWTAFQITALLYSALTRASFRLLRLFFWSKTFIKEVPQKIVSDKVCIITGSNTGIGFETAVSLVERGYEVVMACRSKEKALEAMERLRKRIKSSAQGKVVFVETLDLSSFQSIRKFSEKIAKIYPKLDLLVNNAGRNTSGKSERGLDLCFQTNYLGHFYLTNNLMPLLLNANEPRVINLSSVMHHFCRAKSHDLSYWKRFAIFDSQRESSYSPSKLAMVYMTIALNRYYGSTGLRSIAVNPGAVNSDIWRKKSRFWRLLFRWLYLTNQQGCCTSVAASVADLSESEWYLQPYWQMSTKSTPWPVTEMLGPFVGYQAVQPRLPEDGGILSSDALWQYSGNLVSKAMTGESITP